ncbi:hypothetical protein MBELCI_3022 [Limimaricola cinnabarinus LL-001]|uniref:Uncharacterized protein n=1 Tax=Limimaricola cinnabarinus LL-001 TaxID=1337093 RepID=U2Z6C7_9RHOB|nr:hypothetical protein MBELCI_3022 [Limimaricola cinnabarinus LL-001]
MPRSGRAPFQISGCRGHHSGLFGRKREARPHVLRRLCGHRGRQQGHPQTYAQ